jgi:hypothetical protein
VCAAWDADDVSATLRGLFDLRVELSGIGKDVQGDQASLLDDDEEEAEEAEDS